MTGPESSLLFDPEVPFEDQRLLRRNWRWIKPLGGERLPEKPRSRLRHPQHMLTALFQAPLWVFLPVVLCWLYPVRVRWAAVAAQVGVAVALVLVPWRGLGIAALVLQAIVFAVLAAGPVEPYGQRMLRRHQDRYLRFAALDEPSRELVERAGQAVNAVLSSLANCEGLLDDVHNEVTLPWQHWDIAQTAHKMSTLRAEQERASAGLRTVRIEAARKPQLKALEVATESLERRVAALEEYAERAASVDEVLLELRALQELADDADDYRDLLARVVRDDLATAQIKGLTEQARQVEEMLRASVEEARRAGFTLAAEMAEAG
ncbi:hypothetical protein [Actinomadura hibisca]|uniref:hypothetical protein n=1 Tax=Actinomadura hibisca TaxID=68565 RepID=UPI000829D5C3|nr:hypothetical protein [Actinomadura hibisca]